MLQRFAEFVIEHGLIEEGERVVIGVSGGVDSVVLLYLTRAAGFDPVAAHVNYGLRGAESDADETFVRDLCDQWGVSLHTRRVDLGERSVQMAARTERYAFFTSVAEQVEASVVATAHHRDDQAETLLLNLFRGSGPAGLAGIPIRRPLAPGSAVEVVRPLLWASRAEIEAYARSHGIGWREDTSNATLDYRRNALRHAILPLIEQHFGDGAAGRIAHTADLLRAHLDAEAALVPDAALDALAERHPHGWSFGLDPYRAHPHVVRCGLLLNALARWAPHAPRTASVVAEIDALAEAQVGRRVELPGVTVWRERERLFFETDRAAPLDPVTVERGTTETLAGTLHVESSETVVEKGEASPWVEVVDSEGLRFPLMLRPWRSGDGFVPLGMAGQKLVSDLLTERAVPPHERVRQLVLVCGGEIVWVVGHRLGEAFRVRPETRRTVRLRWTPAASVPPLADDDAAR